MTGKKRQSYYMDPERTTWVGLIRYERSDLKSNYLAIPYKKLSKVRIVQRETDNKLIGLEEQKESYLVGTYKKVEYIIATKVQINTRKIQLFHKPNKSKIGLRLQMKGRLRGVSKAKTFRKGIGQVRTHTFRNLIDYAEKPLQTKWGIFGLKVFIL